MQHAHEKPEKAEAAEAPPPKPKSVNDIHKTYAKAVCDIAHRIEHAVYNIDDTVIANASKRDGIKAELTGIVAQLRRFGVDHDDPCPVP